MVEGRSRLSEVIKQITQTPWTHSAFYIGRVSDIQETDLRERIRQFYSGDDNEPLLVEASIGQGTIITPLSSYRNEHLRLCRPHCLAHKDARTIIRHVVRQLGVDYDTRQLLDLARFMFPYNIIPRRWRSTLFEHRPGRQTRSVCSTMLAEAFYSVRFPIIPIIISTGNGGFSFFRRNPRLFTPKDFDTSPYFDIVKFPRLAVDRIGAYHDFPWAENGKDKSPDFSSTNPNISDLSASFSGKESGE